MDIIILGQFLLGFLAVVAILVNLQLMRLGLRYRKRHKAQATILVAMLFWLPLLAVVLAAGGITLAESSLLSPHTGQDMGWLGWFVLGVGLSIFADTFAALIWIPMREIFNTQIAIDDLVEPFAILASQARASSPEEDEQ
ncbi:MAG TPA: hypothetical protein VKT82_13760 [Ktedonobacterales bacterium]|nr:hypothetical protein [Ktedonobacterales bacterium]